VQKFFDSFPAHIIVIFFQVFKSGITGAHFATKMSANNTAGGANRKFVANFHRTPFHKTSLAFTKIKVSK
jgi:hypothetical protein